MSNFASGYPPPHPQLPAAPRNGLGITALVLGIVGVVFALIPVIGVIAWPLVILGLIFGLLGMQRARKGEATNKGMAIAGTVLSGVGLVLCVVWAAAFGATVANTPMPAAPPLGSMPEVGVPAVPAAPVKPAEGTIPGDGTFMVGTDVQPGTYKSEGGGFCYYSRLKDTTGDFGSIIANNVAQGPATITIKDTDGAFETKGCATWTKVG